MAKNLFFLLIGYLLSVAVLHAYGESHKFTSAHPKKEVYFYWCVAQNGAPADKLQGFLDYACGGHVDCSLIQPSNPCFYPNTLLAHASYALNLDFLATRRCNQEIGLETNRDPSYYGCTYPPLRVPDGKFLENRNFHHLDRDGLN